MDWKAAKQFHIGRAIAAEGSPDSSRKPQRFADAPSSYTPASVVVCKIDPAEPPVMGACISGDAWRAFRAQDFLLFVVNV